MYDESKAREEVLTLPIQINGKLRSRVEITADASEDDIKEKVLSDEKVKGWIGGKPTRKFIVVQKKLVNIVI